MAMSQMHGCRSCCNLYFPSTMILDRSAKGDRALLSFLGFLWAWFAQMELLPWDWSWALQVSFLSHCVCSPIAMLATEKGEHLSRAWLLPREISSSTKWINSLERPNAISKLQWKCFLIRIINQAKLSYSSQKTQATTVTWLWDMV